MPEATPKKVVYLFGAGATHAELVEVVPSLTSDDKLERKLGLLMSHVSARVMREARLKPRFLEDLEFLEPPNEPESVEPATGETGAMNIELLISLIENGKIRRWDKKTRDLKLLVQKDIERRLSRRRKRRFYLHKALFELHRDVIAQDEKVTGIISLNYDDVLDEAYREFHSKPNYCLCLDQVARSSPQIPLLKLHGSFSWRNGVRVRERRRRLEIIPLGSNKNYLHSPYNFIWARALEVLVGCDTLRVVGCSLSQNDTHLVDLLFKAHLERTPARMKTLEIEIINGEEVGKRIRENYRFFPSIKPLQLGPQNPFKSWLTDKSDRVVWTDIKQTKYIKRLFK
jgi:SIR2-like domain